jgi:hypothetical protein
MSKTRSRIELLRDDLIREYEAITKANGYRSDVKGVSDVVMDSDRLVDSPRLSVVFGPESIPIENTAKTIFNSTVSVMVIGYVRVPTGHKDSNTVMVEAAEGLLHDLKRVTGAFAIKYVNSTTNRWSVMKEPQPRATRFVLPQQNTGWVTLEYTVQVWAQDGDF